MYADFEDNTGIVKIRVKGQNYGANKGFRPEMSLCNFVNGYKPLLRDVTLRGGKGNQITDGLRRPEVSLIVPPIGGHVIGQEIKGLIFMLEVVEDDENSTETDKKVTATVKAEIRQKRLFSPLLASIGVGL